MVTPIIILFSFIFSSYWLGNKFFGEQKNTALIFLSLVISCGGLLGSINQYHSTGFLIISIALLLSITTIGIIKNKKMITQLIRRETSVKKTIKKYKPDFLRFINLKNVFRNSPLYLLCIIVSIYGFYLPLAEIDSISYHLPLSFHLINSHTIWDILHQGFTGINTYFPANHEILVSLTQLITHTTHFAFIITLLGVMSFYNALTTYTEKKQRVTINIILLSFISIPFFFKQLLNLQVDLFQFCLYGTGLTYLLITLLKKSSQTLTLFFLTAGLLIGTKFSGAAQIASISPFILLTFWQQRHHLKKIWYLPLLSIPTGMFWYFRNWIVTGNPVFGFDIKAGPLHFIGHQKFMESFQGTTILDSINKNGLQQTITAIQNHHDYPNLINNPFLLFFACIFFVAILFIIIQILHYKKTTARSRKNIFILIFSTFVFSIELSSYLKAPFTMSLWNETIRYSAGVLSILPILLVTIIKENRFLKYFTMIICSIFIIINLSTKSFLVDPITTKTLGTTFQTNKAQITQNQVYLSEKLEGYRIIKPFLEKIQADQPLPSPTIPKIALVGFTQYGLFYLNNLQPVYLNTDGCTNCKYHDYRLEKDSIRANPNQEAWTKLVQEAQINYLLVGTTDPRNQTIQLWEKGWAEENPKIFEKILETSEMSLFKVH